MSCYLVINMRALLQDDMGKVAWARRNLRHNLEKVTALDALDEGAEASSDEIKTDDDDLAKQKRQEGMAASHFGRLSRLDRCERERVSRRSGDGAQPSSCRA